ncbi:glycosyl hydrolase 53 family protein [Pseudaquabacterium terrae]|uniref:glycosyl hydrolase 53 family protein n=1 Tax=Pseudaquabacterium terrae TaxID=2732868 RepID=UPI00156425C4|nr:glycosyl hydrolase 53 family protein [Aquabacterium terrae]
MLNWAEQTYPQYFSGPFADGVYDIYTYRYYPAMGNYIGIAGAKVYVLGPVSGGQILYVGTLGEFRCRIAPGDCPVATREENDDFSSPTIDTCRWFDWSASGGGTSQGNGMRMQTSAAGTFSSARVVSQYMTKGDVQAEITVNAATGFDTAIAHTAQLYASFGLMADDNNRYFIALAKAADKSVIRVLAVSSGVNGAPVFQSFPDIVVTATSIKLRVVQSGATATLSYNIDGNWRTAATLAALSGGAYVELTTTTVGVARQVTATFSDFKITDGTTSWHRYVRGRQQRRADFIAGGTGGDSMNYRIWGNSWGNVNPLQAMKASGMSWYGTDVTFNSAPELAALPPSQWGTIPFQNKFWRAKEIVAQDLKNAAAAGLRLYLQLYLTEGPAHFGTQSAPAAWQGLSVADTASRLRTETHALVSSYKAQGINVEVYAVGNEIDLGILGFRPGERIALPPAGLSTLDVNYLRASVWPTEAILLKAGIEGIKAADPNAKIVLHIAGLSLPVPSDIFIKAFFKFMVDQGVPFDYAALSHPYLTYPGRVDEYSTDCWMQRIQETSDYIATLGKRTMISEGNYPRASGAYAALPMPEFPFTDSGQAGWVREHLRHANNNPNMIGFLYWYPDYFIGMSPNDPGTLLIPQQTGLFYPDLTATPAMMEFGIGPLVGQ